MPRAPKRPGTVIFVAIVLIIVGTWSLLAGVCGVAGVAVLANMPQPPGKPAPGQAAADPMAPQRFIAKEVPGYYPVIFGSVALDMILGLGQLICGIGLIRMSSPARVIAIVLTLAKMLMTWAVHAFSVIFVFPAQSKFFAENPMPAGAPFDAAGFAQTLGVFAIVIQIVIQLAIVLTIVLILSLKSTRDAFAAAGLPEPEPEERRPSGYDDEDDDGYGSPRSRPQSPPDTGITDRP